MSTGLVFTYFYKFLILAAIKKGRVSPSLIEVAIGKNNRKEPGFCRNKKCLSKKQILNKEEILKKLGTRPGQDEILEEIGKGT